MKFLLVLLAAVALASGKPVARNLEDDLQDFLKLIPTDEVVVIVLKHLESDAELQEVVQYVNSEDFKTLVQTVDAIPEYIEFLNYLQDSGLEAYKYVNYLHELLSLTPLTPPTRRSTRSINSLLDEILAVVPREQLRALFNEKLENSDSFKNFVARIQSTEFQSIITKLRAIPQYQELLQKLKNKGVDVDKIIQFIRNLFNVDSVQVRAAPRTLEDDLQDFLKLIPTDKVVAIVLDHLENDSELQEVVQYVNSDDFKTLIKTVDAFPEYIEFLNYLQSSGLDAYKYVNYIHELLNLTPLTPPSSRSTRSINSLLDEILAVVPREQLRALFNEKLETSDSFKNFVARIQSDEFQSIVSKLRAIPQYQELLQKLKDKGVDVDKIIQFIRNLFNVDSVQVRAAPRTLEDDLQDFLKLIPTDEVIAIVLDHLENDSELQEVVQYVNSDDFKTLIKTVDAFPEYIEFLNYLQSSGLDAYKYVNYIHELLNLSPLTPPSRRSTRSINSLLDEILAVVPREQLRALFNEKLETSDSFKNFVARIQSDEFQSIVSKLRAIPQYQELLQKLKDKGVDVDKIIQFIRNLFNVDSVEVRAAPRTLEDDLQDFLKLIPTDKVVAIVLDHLENDSELQEVVQYVNSDDFKTIVKIVDAFPEYIEFLNYLQASGLDAYKYVNYVHELLNLTPLTPPSSRSTRSINSLLDEILAVVPREQLRALFDEKLETSDSFKNFVARIQSDEFQSIVAKLRAIPQYQELLQKLKNKGVDVDKIIQFIRNLFNVDSVQVRAAARTLEDDLQDFLKLIPTDKVIAIVLDHLENDSELQEVVQYVNSDDFKTLIKTVDAFPEYIEFLNYLESSGLDAYKYVNYIHELLNLTPLTPPSSRSTRSINSLLDEILAVVPREQLRALFNEKLETSDSFKNFVARIQSDEFQSIVSKLRAIPQYQELLQKLKNKGVDVDKIIQFIRNLFNVSK